MTTSFRAVSSARIVLVALCAVVGCAEEDRQEDPSFSAGSASAGNEPGTVMDPTGSTGVDPSADSEDESGFGETEEFSSTGLDEEWSCAASGDSCGCTLGYEFFSGELVETCEDWNCCWSSEEGKCACQMRDSDLFSCEEFVASLSFEAQVVDACGYEPEPETGEDPQSGGGGREDECSGDSDCGYREACSGGRCQTVQCTNDAHCGGCTRCSGNACVSCGSGPYGCYC